MKTVGVLAACLVALVAGEAEPKADAHYLGRYGHRLGYHGYGYGHYPYGYGYTHHLGKREAEAEPTAVADAHYGYGYGHIGYSYGHYPHYGYGHYPYHGYGYGYRHHGKREAEATPEADAHYGHYGYGHGWLLQAILWPLPCLWLLWTLHLLTYSMLLRVEDLLSREMDLCPVTLRENENKFLFILSK